jgi:hypothetical protein
VRKERLNDELRLSPAERVARALGMGETALVMFMRASGLSREEALRQLESNKHKGRRRSCAFPKPR